ncbi:MAG: pantoate--beta-alanine ligase [Candidatus Nanopelagicales bacterium]
MPKIIDSLAALDEHISTAPEQGRAVVMTMGALHPGHMSLVDTARELVGPAGEVMVTIFVNPLQFGANEDLDKYPRTFDDDVAMCEAAGVDVIFAPTPELMYPDGEAAITIQPGPLGALYEGAARPTHFAGVLTVVAKLLNLTKPNYAVYGEKDYQQLALIGRMARELNSDVEIVGSPTIREADGLALSSRNRYLDEEGRQAASEISTAIELAQQTARAGGTAEEIAATAQDHLAQFPALKVDYVVLTSNDLGDPPTSGSARLLVTAYVGSTRLLDNAEVVINSGS